MITYETIKNLTNEDIAELKELLTIADEAEKIEELIKSSFAIYNERGSKVVWQNKDKKAKEYLTLGGSWSKMSEDSFFTVDCNAATIFDYLYAEYVYKNKRPCALKDEKVAKMAKTCGHFREFVKMVREKHDSMSQ